MASPFGTWGRRLCLVFLVALLAGCQRSPQATAPLATLPHYQLTYAAVGASDAFGVGTDDPADESWPTDLSHSLSATTHLINLGIPGATVEQAARLEVPIALDAHPDIITVWLAVNDLAANVSLATYTAQLSAMLTVLRTNTTARIYVGNLPNLTELPSFADHNPVTLEAQITAWNQAISRVCATQHVTLVDIFSTWTQLASHPEYISADGLHPSALGAEKLADLFARAIATA